jgi:DNA polymerase-3 subunit gamma/tau
MENFIVSARKYRPATFDTVVGQQSITTTLKNAIKNNHLAQAYLFCGPRGVGKTTCARIFAKTINCFHITPQTEACQECESCKSFTESRSYNIHELDAASNNSVDDIRNLIDQVRIPPQVGKYSIYIIDEVHMLSTQAFNAFLKTLEEPPKHAVFILATTEKHKIIPTILSRCQIFDFNRIQIEDSVSFLEGISKKEGNEYEVDALNIIAQKADGAMRDALSIYDQIVSFSGGKITYKSVIENLNILDYDYFFRLTDAFVAGNITESFLIFNEILNDGFDAHNFVIGLSKHLRDILVCKDAATIQLLEVGNNIREKYKSQAAQCSTEFLFDALALCGSCDLNFKSARNQRLHVELTLVQLCQAIEKKKTTNEPVISKPVQPKPEPKKQSVTIPPAVTISNQPAKPAQQQTSNFIKKSAPSSPSIKDILKGGNSTPPTSQPVNQEDNEDKEEDDTSPIRENKFTAEQLVSAYANYVNSIKEDKPRQYSSLTTQTPELVDKHTIKLVMSNSNQVDDFMKNIKPDLINHLRNELLNDSIVIEVQIEEQENQNRLFTAEEKLKHMIAKNPALGKLKQQFNLDFE